MILANVPARHRVADPRRPNRDAAQVWSPEKSGRAPARVPRYRPAVYKATADQVTTIAVTLAKAFDDDPVMT